MNNAPIKSIQSDRTISSRPLFGNPNDTMLAITSSTSGAQQIALDVHGVDALIARLVTHAPTDWAQSGALSLANSTSTYTDDQLRYRIKTSAGALMLRKERTDKKVVEEKAAAAEAIKLADAKTQATLSRRPAPGVYELTTHAGLMTGHTIVTEDRRIFVRQFDDGGVRKYNERTSFADATTSWTFIKAPLTPELINDAFKLVDDLTTWLQMATK